MNKVFQKWNYGVDPSNVLAFETAWTTVTDEVETMGSSVFLDLIRKNLIDNTHSAVIQLFPKTGMVHEAEVAEQQRIQQMQQQYSKEDFTKLLSESANLEQVQAEPNKQEALKTIPHVPLSSIDSVEYPNTINLRVEQDVLVATTRVPESFGLLYVDFGIDRKSVV